MHVNDVSWYVLDLVVLHLLVERSIDRDSIDAILLSAISNYLWLSLVFGFIYDYSNESFVLVRHKLVINVMRFEVRYLAAINVL